MRKLVISISTFFIIIGFIALALNMTIGSQTAGFLYPTKTDSGFTLWRYDTQAYIKNILTSVNTTTELTLRLPDLTWHYANGEIVDFFNALADDLKVIVNFLILVLNIILYPLRIGAYLVRNALTIVGVNLTTQNNNGLYWLKTLTTWLMSMQVPYIN